ncbi:MAG: DUF4142 domain-containing protein [Candidatus Andeanibacterium colombiense]|uniref:DUF4142 domain-containing protein n=1 Tax=Candidatus Andeanibacterium colombiense TaxID=3121345 RepID=A0AAJ5X8C5_9SPHN|nr:MAG: DUF4142 domain-containing protein [Sphingomonadaceae bacterium]
MILRASALTLSLLALMACGSSPGDTASDANNETSTPAPATTVAVQQFVDTVGASDLYETEAGRLAQHKGSAQAVKDFGAMMVKDHANSTADLKAAVATNPDLMLSPQLTADQQAKLDQLKGASGSAFDDAYAMQQVAAHEDALGLLKDYGTSGTEAALRDFAGKAAPVVAHHLEMARKLP